MSDEVNRSIRDLGLTDRLRPLRADEAARVHQDLERRFVEVAGLRWIWERLRPPVEHRHDPSQRGFERLDQLVPDPAADLLFFPASDEEPRHVYRGRIDAIIAVIGDGPAYEYVICPLGLDWLVGENHHGVFFAAGEPVRSRLAGVI